MDRLKKCRLCGEHSSKNMYSLFSKNHNEQQLLQLIKDCLPILIYRKDPFPKHICETCYVNLNDYSSFRNKTIQANIEFQSELADRWNEFPVQLYANILEHTVQSEYTSQTFSSPNLHSTTSRSTQSEIEFHTQSTNTSEPSSKSNLTILTPSVINAISESSILYSALTTEESTEDTESNQSNPRKRRRLLSKPKKLHSPRTLLQYALAQINLNLNLIEEKQSEDEQSESESAESRTYSPDLSLMQPNVHISVVPEELQYNFSVNLNEPVVCNYCMKKFQNIIALSHHEIQHIKVDIGARCDSTNFRIRQKNLSNFYQNWLAVKSTLLKPKPEFNLPSDFKPKSDFSNICPKVPIKSSARLEAKMVSKTVNVTNVSASNSNATITNEKNTPMNSVNVPVKSAPEEVEENSLLIPSVVTTGNNVFGHVNNEITVDGIPLKSIDKKERRTMYKTILVSGKKRKFCPLCRHTFKDCWAIEYHYFNNICQYTCKYCGRKYKYQKELFESHLKLHKGEANNKIFGPKASKKKEGFLNRDAYVKKVKPIKAKQQRKLVPPIKIKKEPVFGDYVTMEASSSDTQQQTSEAYFCRQCYKVFFKKEIYNEHVRICTGEDPIIPTSNKRPSRTCAKETAALRDLYVERSKSPPLVPKKKKIETDETGYECTVCCSAFPSKASRNSHMRIHKNFPVKYSAPAITPAAPKPVMPKIAPKSHAIIKPKPQQIAAKFVANARNAKPNEAMNNLNNLNSTVARLVQNNPHLTIRSYSKSQPEKQFEFNSQTVEGITTNGLNESYTESQVKRVYKCADCNGKFENKSVLYYHKMNSCIIQRHYECAFCRKRFGTYDQYNTHMFYIHPE